MNNVISNIFKKDKKEEPTRDIRELLRENLKLLSVDMFYIDDPVSSLNEKERRLYLKYFFDIYKDKRLIERIKFNINRQAQKTLGNSQNGTEDMAGSMNINGLAFVLNDIERLANMYIKEFEAQKPKKIDKFAIIPETG